MYTLSRLFVPMDVICCLFSVREFNEQTSTATATSTVGKNNNVKWPHSAYSKKRDLRQPIIKNSFSNFEAVLHTCLG